MRALSIRSHDKKASVQSFRYFFFYDEIGRTFKTTTRSIVGDLALDCKRTPDWAALRT